ncbi:MAG: EAL domain-containing protein [Stappiaceae bacterium]
MKLLSGQPDYDAVGEKEKNDFDDSLIIAKVTSLSSQVPMLYLLLTVNSVILAISFIGTVPNVLAVAFPGILVLATVARAAVWLRLRGKEVTVASARRKVRSVMILSVVFSVCYVSWALLLSTYGDAYQKSHVAFYVAITVIGCIFSLSPHPLAALLVMGTVMIPFAIRFALMDNPVFLSITINMALVCVVLYLNILLFARNFSQTVLSQVRLQSINRETQILSEENARLAHLDTLTGLPNRRDFNETLDAALVQYSEKEGQFAIGVLDLDGFKPINDAYGHLAGDQVLAEVATRLRAILNNVGYVARLGGDEFGIIIGDLSDPADVEAIGKQLLQSLKKNFECDAGKPSVSGCAGFAIYPQAGRSRTELFAGADFALYHAKMTQRGSMAIFSKKLESRIKRRALLEQNLQRAVEHGEFTITYQPIVDLDTRNINCLEALARWECPGLGKVSPEEFIPIAEKSGFIESLTEQLLKRAMKAALAWPKSVKLSFNMSAQVVTKSEAKQLVVDALAETGLDPRRLKLEITETALITDFENVKGWVHSVRELGIQVSLDDFGSGYSSLGYLQSIPFDEMKIDKGFTAQIEHDSKSFGIVRSILSMARTLEIDCVVEGIETASQLQIIRSMDGALGQGYYFASAVGEACIGETLAQFEGDALAISYSRKTAMRA